MTSLEPTVSARARRAYERGRLLRGLGYTWPLLGLIPAALWLHAASLGRIALVAAALAIALVAAAWRGRGWARGALPGVLGGLPAFFVPYLVAPAGSSCERCAHPDAHWSTCLALCFAASLSTGVVLAVLARRDRDPRGFAASAALMAALTAAITCSLAGAAGLGGVALGVTAASLPVLLTPAPRRA